MDKKFKLLYENMVLKIEDKYNKKLSLNEKKNLLEFIFKNTKMKIQYDPQLKIITNSHDIIKDNEQIINNGGTPEDLEENRNNIGFSFRSLDDNNLKRLIIQKAGNEEYDRFLLLKENKDFDGLTNFFINNDIEDYSYYNPLFEGQLFQFPGLYDFIKIYYKYELKPIPFQFIPKAVLIGIYRILLKGINNPNEIIKNFSLDRYSENTRNQIMDYFSYIYGLDKGLNFKNYVNDLRALKNDKYNNIFLYLIK
jgi:hypothetical protein